MELTSGGYTCVIQPRDVGAMKSLKGVMQKNYGLDLKYVRQFDQQSEIACCGRK